MRPTAVRDEVEIVRVDDIDCAFEPRPWPYAERHAAEIDAHWQRAIATNPKLFNGRVLLQHHGRVEAEGARRTFRGGYLEMQFKAFMAWRDFGFPDPSVRNCFAMAALLATDGAFILAEMAAHTANPGRVYFPAGTPDPQDIVEGRVDLEGSAIRELAEETGLTEGDIRSEDGWTIVIGAHRIACMKTVRASEPAAVLLARIHAFLARDPHSELARVHAVSSAGNCEGLDMPPFMLAYLEAAFAKT
ncbi:MAG: NUDIX hydrolase [Methylobacteriaceae bacterium]|nr:NUDIX hydrolase [Methylobacteriaceae bacterium]